MLVTKETKKREPTVQELGATAIAPLDPNASLEKNLSELCLNLGIADTLNAALRHAIKENPEVDIPANRRKPIRIALIAVMARMASELIVRGQWQGRSQVVMR
jgi:hypothetical protein